MTTIDDSEDLARFGYRQELNRTLGSFSSFAAGFSYLSILTGLFQLFYFGFGAGGPMFIWSWPLVLTGQFLVALGFAELAAHYPLSGGAYQWSKLTGSPRTGFIVGWIYLACLVVTLSAVALALQALLPQVSSAFQVIGSAGDTHASAMNAVLLGCGLIVLTTTLNAVKVSVLARVNNAGVLSELFGAILLIVLLWVFAQRRPDEVLMAGTGGEGGSALGALLGSALAASYVMYGFDTAGSLAEETTNPRRRAPRAILQALAAAGLLGFLLLLGAMMAARDLNAGDLGRIDGGLPSIVTATLGGAVGRVLLVDVILAVFVCALAVHASAVRLVFAMARDGLLPVLAVSGSSVPELEDAHRARVRGWRSGDGHPRGERQPSEAHRSGDDGRGPVGESRVSDRHGHVVAKAVGGMAASRGEREGLFFAGPAGDSHKRRGGRVELVHGCEHRLAARRRLRPAMAASLRAGNPHGDSCSDGARSRHSASRTSSATSCRGVKRRGQILFLARLSSFGSRCGRALALSPTEDIAARNKI